MKKTLILSGFCLFLLRSDATAQDFTFSQYQALPYLVNPAETGGGFPGQKVHRIGIIYRDHWDSPASEPALFGGALGWDMRICKGSGRNYFLSAGAFLQQEGTSGGGIHNLYGRGLLSFHHTLGRRAWLAAGFSVGGLQYGVRQDKLTFDAQYNPQIGDFDLNYESGEHFNYENRLKMDGDAGIRFFGSLSETATKEIETWWSVGISWHHVPKPVYSFLEDNSAAEPNRLEHGFSVQLAYKPVRHLLFNGFYRQQSLSKSRQWQGVFSLACPMRLFKPNRFLAGAQARVVGDRKGRDEAALAAFVPFVKLETKNYTLGASWDIPCRKLKNSFGGGLELSATFFLGEKSCIICPEI